MRIHTVAYLKWQCRPLCLVVSLVLACVLMERARSVSEMRTPLDPPAASGTPGQLAQGAQHYARFCSGCHGDAAYGSTVLPDLRRSTLIADGKAWSSVVQAGALQERGMVSFANVLNPEQIEAIRHYVIMRANEDKALGLQ